MNSDSDNELTNFELTRDPFYFLLQGMASQCVPSASVITERAANPEKELNRVVAGYPPKRRCRIEI